jgi:hypothetical protein
LTSEMPKAEVAARGARIAAKKRGAKQQARNAQVGGVYDNKTPLDA